MTFMHMDATAAAAAVGNTVGFTWEDTPPFSNIVLDDGGDGFWGESTFIMYGEGAAFPGDYKGWEHAFEVLNEEWINPAFVGQIPQYFFRTIDIATYSDGTIPGITTSYAGVWTNGRTDWRCFAIVAPHSNMTPDTTAQWECQAAGAYGSSYYEETIVGVVEIGKLVGLTETFDAADVYTGSDEIEIVGHGFETGDQVVFTTGSGSAPAPMFEQSMYSVRKISSSRIKIGHNLAAIDLTTVYINLSTTGTGTGNTLQRIDAVASVNLFMDTST